MVVDGARRRAELVAVLDLVAPRLCTYRSLVVIEKTMLTFWSYIRHISSRVQSLCMWIVFRIAISRHHLRLNAAALDRAARRRARWRRYNFFMSLCYLSLIIIKNDHYDKVVASSRRKDIVATGERSVEFDSICLCRLSLNASTCSGTYVMRLCGLNEVAR